MDDGWLALHTLWIDVAVFCSLDSIGKLRRTCIFLNELLTSNVVWKRRWIQLCTKYCVNENQISHVYRQTPTPRMYLNLCYRLQASHEHTYRRHTEEWFVLNPNDEIESFTILQDLKSFSYFDSSQLRKKAESSRGLRMRSAFSTIVPVRDPKQCMAPSLDSLTDVAFADDRLENSSFSELWPFDDKDMNIFINHRIAMLIRRKMNWKEKCLSRSRLPGKSCIVPPAFCSLNFLGSGWRLKRRELGGWGAESILKTFKNLELRCIIHELLKPGIVANKAHKEEPFYVRIPFSLPPEELNKFLDLFFRVLQCSCLIAYNLPYHVSNMSQAETCLVIESYNYYTVITPVVEGVVCSDVIRCKRVGFAHVVDYLVLCLNLKNACNKKPLVKTSSFMLSTNPERMKMAFSLWLDIRRVLMSTKPVYSDQSQLGCTHTGATVELRNSVFGTFKGIDSCDRSEFLVLLATEYMYKCLDPVAMVLDLLVQFEWAVVRRLIGRIFMVGENTRIWGFRERFCKDLKAGLDGVASVLGRDASKNQLWSVNCVHAEVENGPTAMYASILGKMDYVLRGPDFF